MSDPNNVNIYDEYKRALKRAEHERDLYRARAIDEYMASHPHITREYATYEVDAEVMQLLSGGMRNGPTLRSL